MRSTTLYYCFVDYWLPSINNKPVLKQIQSTVKGALKAPKKTLRDTVLRVDYEAKAQKLFLKWKEKYITDHKEHVKTITVWVILGKVLGSGSFIFIR